ncbi:MAG: histidine phosphatase family protein [Sulfuritalea sp.]|nr:histidine phosphatase family protein [Sulfuritalea sp.]MBK8121966.1 histidine phosphatase family protein [Sulfuritalea sp.]
MHTARAVAEELRTIEFALAFSSELPRARQSAAIS